MRPVHPEQPDGAPQVAGIAIRHRQMDSQAEPLDLVDALPQEPGEGLGFQGVREIGRQEVLPGADRVDQRGRVVQAERAQYQPFTLQAHVPSESVHARSPHVTRKPCSHSTRPPAQNRLSR